MSKVIKYLPELDGDEQVTVARLLTDMTEEQAEHFAHVYRQRRKDESTTLLLTAVAFIGVAGLNRFYLGQIGMGFLYVVTLGFCLIGPIIDIFNYKSLVGKHNSAKALETAELIQGAFPAPVPTSTKPGVIESGTPRSD
jgi:TM2 domain-containing membrane protein YozV